MKLNSSIALSKINRYDPDIEYELTLKIHFETNFGEYLAVTGNLE